MHDSRPDPTEPAARVIRVSSRILAGVFGLVLGAILGIVVVLLTGAFGDAFVPVMAACTFGLATLGAVWPSPWTFRFTESIQDACLRT